MAVLVRTLRGLVRLHHCGCESFGDSSNGIKMFQEVSDDLFSTGILPELFAIVPFFKDLELNLYSDLCSCGGSSPARIIYLRACQCVWDQVRVHTVGRFVFRTAWGTKFIGYISNKLGEILVSDLSA